MTDTTTGTTESPLSPGELTTLLNQSGEPRDTVVSDVHAERIGTGQMGTNFRLTLSYASSSDEAPHTVIAKLPSDDPASVEMARWTSAYIREVRFYQQLADHVTVRAPRCFGAYLSDDGLDFVLLLEDLEPATLVNQLTGYDAEQAAAAITEMAALHGSTWDIPLLARHAWLDARAVWTHFAQSIPQLTSPFLERFEAHLRPGDASVVERFAGAVDRWLPTLDHPRNLWHADFRADNLLLEAYGGTVPAAVLDWQSVSAAPGTIDLAYFLGTSVTSEVRAQNQRTLVEQYHAQLLEHGVEDFTFDHCWREYRMHALFPLLLTIPVSMGVEQTERGNAMFGTMAQRAIDQITDLNSFAELP